MPAVTRQGRWGVQGWREMGEEERGRGRRGCLDVTGDGCWPSVGQGRGWWTRLMGSGKKMVGKWKMNRKGVLWTLVKLGRVAWGIKGMCVDRVGN